MPVACAGALLEAACGPPPRIALEPTLRTLGAMDCPEEEIRVLETREFGDDVVYRFDACGAVLEIEHGYLLPRRRSAVVEFSDDNPLVIPPRVRRGIWMGDVEKVRRKVQSWCVLGTPPTADTTTIAFYNATSAELDACRKRLAESLRPVGTEAEPDSDTPTLWFTMGQYGFTVRDALYPPPPEHRIGPVNQPRPTTPQSRSERVARAHRARVEQETVKRERIKNPFAARVEFGAGYLGNDAGERSTRGPSVNTRIELGLKVAPNFGVGFRFATTTGLAGDDSTRPNVLETGVVATLYPVANSGLRVSAHASAGEFTYGFGHDGFAIVPVVGGTLGHDFGERGRSTKFEGWTGASVSLSGFYGPGPEQRVTAALVTAGTYFW